LYYRINQIKLKIGEDEQNIPKHIIKKLGKDGKGISISDWQIARKSLDARDKGDIRFVYTVDFAIEQENKTLNLPEAVSVVYQLPESGGKETSKRPVVCGFGPAGMFAGLILAQAGYKPLVIERGSAMEKRVADVEKFWKEGILNTASNVQFGEGGAGTFSDGKLTTGIKDTRIAKVLKELVEAGADEEILYLQKPHIGTDKLRNIVVRIREKITELGGKICFDTCLDRVIMEDNCIKGIEIISYDQTGQIISKDSIETDTLILAIGHSARDTFRTLYAEGLEMTRKPFSIGVRAEHPQSMVNESQYGKNYPKDMLPPAEYKLSCKSSSGRGVYTFCMCPGGDVITASSQEGGIVTNGMSYSKRDGEFANSAVLVDVRTEDFPGESPLAGIDFQEKYERLAFENGGNSYKAPKCTWKQMRDGDPEGKKVEASLPDFAATAIKEAMPQFGRKLRGFDRDDTIFTAVESRSSSPVRIVRDAELEASIKGIYPAGEGAGYAGGIVSAAVDGIRCAEALIKKWATPKDSNL